MKRLILGASLCLLALVINPTVGCSSSEDEFRFSEADMRTAVAGKYTGSISGTSEMATLTLTEGTNAASSSPQSLGARQLQQCSRSFSFVKPAAACIPTTTMAVSGQVSSSNGSIATSVVNGIFEIHSADLTDGVITLTLTDTSTVTSSFQNGAFGVWQYRDASGLDYSLDLAKE